MSISSVNPYMSMMAAYKAAQEKSNAASSVQEVAETKLATRPGDTVSISQEASQKSRAEQYALKDNPIELFNEWLLNDGRYANLGPSSNQHEDLLPENQELIKQLKREMEGAPLEERWLLQADIDTLSRFGDKEIFSNRQDISSRLNVENIASAMKYAYVEKKYGEVVLPPGLEYLEGGRSTLVSSLAQSQY